jgi:hypothetical protein
MPSPATPLDDFLLALKTLALAIQDVTEATWRLAAWLSIDTEDRDGPH